VRTLRPRGLGVRNRIGQLKALADQFLHATLIRSAGLSLTKAAAAIAASATRRACAASCTTPRRDRTKSRCRHKLRGESNTAATSPPNSKYPRTWSTTTAGTSSRSGNYPRRWKLFSSTTSANR
jgi:hypothetical protein